MATILKPSYGASAALTVTNLQSLATNSTWTTGWSSAVQDNTSNLSIDEQISGVFATGTSPTVSTIIEIWAWGILDDVPTYPDTITGSEAGAIALTSANVKLAGAFARLGSITVDNTTNRVYPFSFSLAQNGFGYVPKKWGLWVSHNTGVALKSSGNAIARVPLQYTNV